MPSSVRRRRLLAHGAIALSAATLAGDALAGGGPMNVVVVYNGDVPEAATVAHHYEQARALPAGHLCALPGLKQADTTIDAATFASKVQTPVDACLSALPHPELVDYLVLVRGLPYVVNLPSYSVSLQAALQVRHAKAVGNGPEIAGAGQPGGTTPTVANPLFPPSFQGFPADFALDNPFKAWYENATLVSRAKQQPRAFHAASAPAKAGTYEAAGGNISWAPDAYDWSGNNLAIVSSLDGFDFKDAAALVDRGVASDGTMPKAELLCMHGEDDARGARDPECELVTRLLAGAGLNAAFVSPFNGALAGHTVAAYFTGSADTVKGAIAGNTFAPGAITCNLTSYGAVPSNFFCDATGTKCPENETQTSVARFVRAGATGAHGTVAEPLNAVFPSAGALLYYTFGYSLGESYFFSQRFLYWQNLYLGDPLATPYAIRPAVTVGDAGGMHARNREIVITAAHPAGIVSIDLFNRGKRVASGMGDRLTYAPTGAVGESLDLLAVAVAVDAPVTRAGWKNPSQQPHAEVQGWTSTKVTLAADAADSEPTAGLDAGVTAAPAANGDGGCGCVIAAAPNGSATAGGAAALSGLLALVRRRQRRPESGEIVG